MMRCYQGPAFLPWGKVTAAHAHPFAGRGTECPCRDWAERFQQILCVCPHFYGACASSGVQTAWIIAESHSWQKARANRYELGSTWHCIH